MQQETTRERLLGSTSRKFLSNGYQKTSLRTICRSTGITTNTLHFFFKDRSALLRILIKGAAEAVIQMLYQHISFEEEVYSNTDQLMDVEHDTRFVQELVPFYYAHEMALKLLFNCSQGSAHQNFAERVIAYLIKRNMKIISVMVKDDNTIFNARTSHWLSQIQVRAFLHILSHYYSQEQALHQIRIAVTFLRGGFEGLYQQAVKDQIRGIFLFSFTVQRNSVMLCQACQ